MANSYRKGAQGQVRLIYLSFPFVLALSLFGTATMKPCIDRVQNEARQSTIVAFFLAIFFFKNRHNENTHRQGAQRGKAEYD